MTDKIHKYDFANSQTKLPSLPGVSESQRRFRSRLQSILNRQLRFETTISSEESAFAEQKQAPNASFILPLADHSRGLLVTLMVCPALASMYANLRQGGLPGQGQPDRPLGQVGESLLHQLAQVAAAALTQAWQGIAEMELEAASPDLLSSEQLQDGCQRCLHFDYVVSFGHISGKLTIGYPEATLRRLKRGRGGRTRLIDPEWHQHISKKIYNMPVELVAELGSAQLTVQELQQLQPGDVIMLNRFANEPIDIRVEGRVKLKGEPGLSRGRRSVKILR